MHKGSLKPLGIMKGGKHVHLFRWFSHIESLQTTQLALSELAEAKSRGVRSLFAQNYSHINSLLGES